jgi:Xaa-Pro aminopeptidase
VTRIGRLAGALEEPLLVTNVVNVRYLTGFESTNAALLVEHHRATLYADFRYAEAGAEVEGVEFTLVPRNLLGELATILAGRRVAFEANHLPYAGYQTLTAGGVDLVPSRGRVERLRAVKEPAEVEAMRQAAELSDEVFAALAAERFTGRTERELAWFVERRFRELGATGVSFPVIVAAGPNASRPHVASGERLIEPGTLVIVDAGCVVDGYCSDCTRTFAAGQLTAELEELHSLCVRAQLDGLAAVRPGAVGRDADAASRTLIEAAGLGERYGHGLGHGVGLAIHEEPTLRPESGDVLEAGNVVTVEPGIYLPGVAGVRIEDLVVVTAEGCERLTLFPKELLTVE